MITRAEPADRNGRIIPIRDNDYVGRPIIGHVVRMDDGIYSFTDRDECVKHDTENKAIEFIERKWRSRK